MTLEHAELDLTASVGGSQTTGTFEMKRGSQSSPLSIGQSVVPSFPLGGRGGGLLNTAANATKGSSEEKRESIMLDVGAGKRVVQVSFSGHTGGSYTWGDGSGSLPQDATGASATAQRDILFHYLNVGTYDSSSPATLRVGEHSPSGSLSALNVVPREPDIRVVNDEEGNDILSGTMTFVVVADAGNAWDADNRSPR